MESPEAPAAVHHTIIFSVRGLLSDADAVQALATLGIRLTDDGQAHATRPVASGRWLACGLRSDGLVELWAADSGGGWLVRLLEAAGMSCAIADCLADQPPDERR